MRTKFGRFAVVIFSVVLISVSAAQAQPHYRHGFVLSWAEPDEARSIFNAGVHLFDQGRYAEAEHMFREVIRRFPRNPIADRTHYYLIRTQVKLDRLSEALARIDSFLRAYPKSRWLNDVMEERIRLTNEVTPEGIKLLVSPAPPAPREGSVEPLPFSGPNSHAPALVVVSPFSFQAATSGNPEVSLQQEVLRALFKNSPERAIEIASDRLRSNPTDPVVLSNMYMMASSRSEKALPVLTTIAKNSTNANARRDAIFWISRSRFPNRTSILEGIYRESADDAKLRRQIVFALGQVRDREAVKVMGTIAATDPDLSIRREAMVWLQQIKTLEALPDLENLLRQR